MTAAWTGSLAEGMALAQDGALGPAIESGFRAAFGTPGPAEVAAWRTQAPALLEAIVGSVSPQIRLAFEYKLPFNGQRADCVVIGRRGGRPAAHVVELKRWDRTEPSSLPHFVRVGGHDTQHPSYQAANYAGKLRFFHSVAQGWDVSASAAVFDRDPAFHAALRGDRYAEILDRVPVFLPGESRALAARLASLVPEPGDAPLATEFLAGRYEQSLQLLDAIREHHKEIIDSALGSLADAGWGMSEEQLRVFDEVLFALDRGDRAVYLVRGGPGSGKTMLALHLLLAGARRRGMRRAVLAMRNNRLVGAIRGILETADPGLQGLVKFFSTRGGDGVEDRNDRIADLLVCDEAQRLTLKGDLVFQRAPLTVVIYDESQMLNFGEHGREEVLEAMARGLGLEVRPRMLRTPHRCRGGEAYLAWVEQLLSDPTVLIGGPAPWRSAYDVRVAGSAADLVDSLRGQHLAGRSVAMVAAFTRSDGTRRGLGKVRIPRCELEPSAPGDIVWAMDPKTEYLPFWVHGRSNDLESCASIYGCQGFETDVAGIVWGDDLVIRKGRWTVGNAGNCFDDIEKGSSLPKLMRENPEQALIYLRNRYRVFLTRGILGARIHCEDEETREFLRGVLAIRAAADPATRMHEA